MDDSAPSGAGRVPRCGPSRPPDGGRFISAPDPAGPARPFTIDDPNFNIKSLRLNGVVRWEWKPGSTLYFVWTENRRNTDHPGDYSFRRDFGDLLTAPPDDVVMVKASWWIGR